MKGMQKQQAKRKPSNEFLPGPVIPGHSVSHCDAHRLLMLDGQVIKFSRIEYPIVLLILRKTDGYVSFAQLIRAAYGSDADANTIKLLRRRMSSIRLKLWNQGIIIISVNGCGYSYKTYTPGEDLDEAFKDFDADDNPGGSNRQFPTQLRTR